MAYTGSCGTNATYNLDTSTGVLQILGTGAMTDYSSSTAMPWRYFKSSIKTVTIASGITHLGAYAFYELEITSINIPNTVTSIGDYCFSTASSLTSLVIPDSVKTIGISAFAGCSALTSVTIGSGVTSIGNTAFNGDAKITSITFNGNQPTLGSNSFKLSNSSSIKVTSTVYSKGWASDSVFTSTVKGSYTTFTYVKTGVTVHVNVSGSWKESTPYVNVNGTWKEVTAVYVNVNGTWKEVS